VYPTPLVRLDALSVKYSNEIYAKLETVNPTGSHKDRESLQLIRDMIKKGFKSAVIASTGNAAISLSALAPASRIQVHVFVSRNIAQERLNLLSTFKPTLHVIEGSYDDAVKMSNEFAADEGAYLANPGHNMAKLIGDSGMGREIAKQMKRSPPDYVVVPTNNGTLLAGLWMGLNKNSEPAMVAAIARNSELMSSIAGYHRHDGTQLDRAITESNGIVVDISDREAARATYELLHEGILCEPASAAGLAAVKKIRIKGKSVVVVITGSGLKFMESYKMAIGP
jgi:threonine synthase